MRPGVPTGRLSLFEVRSSPISGMGCFAIVPLSTGERIWRFTGPVRTAAEMRERVARGAVRSADDPLQVEAGLYMDLEPPAIHFNHSCEPNAYIRSDCNLVSLRPIAPGDEITYDYSLTVSASIPWTMECHCGMRRCRGRVSTWTSVDRATLRRRVRDGTIQAFVSREVASRRPLVRIRRWMLRQLRRIGSVLSVRSTGLPH